MLPMEACNRNELVENAALFDTARHPVTPRQNRLQFRARRHAQSPHRCVCAPLPLGNNLREATTQYSGGIVPPRYVARLIICESRSANLAISGNYVSVVYGRPLAGTR